MFYPGAANMWFGGSGGVPEDGATLYNQTMNKYAKWTMASIGSRSPANKFSNVVYVPQSAGLSVGTQYSYVICTTGARVGYRTLWDGVTNATSRAYNSGYDPGQDLPWNGLASEGTFYPHQGNFVYQNNLVGPWQSYDPTNVIGFLIAYWTAGASDPGKGGIRLWVYDQDTLKDIYQKLYTTTGGNPMYAFDPNRV